jgi:hypothetical protein
VWERFRGACIDAGISGLMDEVWSLHTAMKHRPRFPQTGAHQKFLKAQAEKAREIMRRNPEVDLGEELGYFQTSAG